MPKISVLNWPNEVIQVTKAIFHPKSCIILTVVMYALRFNKTDGPNIVNLSSFS